MRISDWSSDVCLPISGFLEAFRVTNASIEHPRNRRGRNALIGTRRTDKVTRVLKVRERCQKPRLVVILIRHSNAICPTTVLIAHFDEAVGTRIIDQIDTPVNAPKEWRSGGCGMRWRVW